MNSPLMQWAIRNHVSIQALRELDALFGIPADVLTVPPNLAGESEGAAQSAVRLEAAAKGVKLWRNNVGSLKDARGVPVRYGLANDSKKLNEVVKSGDLIGWRRVEITPAHVGSTIAQFVSRECKRPGWTFDPNDPHEAAQLAWIKAVSKDGGDAMFCTGAGTL